MEVDEHDLTPVDKRLKFPIIKKGPLLFLKYEANLLYQGREVKMINYLFCKRNNLYFPQTNPNFSKAKKDFLNFAEPSRARGATPTSNAQTSPLLIAHLQACLHAAFWDETSRTIIRAARLHLLPGVHVPSIDQVFFLGSLPCSHKVGRLVLGAASRLDAFSAYPFLT
jgi:hypothetical protein